MEAKRKIRNALMAVMLFLIAFTFTSCDALIGDGEITFGYFIGCVVCAFCCLWSVSLYVLIAGSNEPSWSSCSCFFLAIILGILPFLWHPIPKFNFILLIVSLVQSVLFGILGRITVAGGTELPKIKLPKSKKERERESKEAAERQAREEQEAKERAEREAREAEEKAKKEAERKARKEQKAKELAEKEAKEAAERKAREEQEAKERAEREAAIAARKKAAAEKLASYMPSYISDEMIKIDADDDAPVNPFFMAKTTVTEELWGLVYPETEPANPQRPITGVSFYKAIEFCNRMSKAAGLRPCYIIGGSTNPDKWPSTDNTTAWDEAECIFEADGFRLPEESEFLYACTGGAANEQTLYPGSSNMGEVAWCEFNSDGVPHDVATKKPNNLGLFDLNGNVQQWTWDRGDNDTPDTPERLAYGGSFKLAAWQNFGRASVSATCAADDMGLRLVRSVL